jgi:PAS domain S-box-containing protein
MFMKNNIQREKLQGYPSKKEGNKNSAAEVISAYEELSSEEKAIVMQRINGNHSATENKPSKDFNEDNEPQSNRVIIENNLKNTIKITELERVNQIVYKANYDLKKLNKKLTYNLIKRTTQYSFLSQINQSIVQTRSEASLFRKACFVAYHVGKFKVAWIGVLDDKSGRVNMVAQKGIVDADLNQVIENLEQENKIQNKVITTGKSYLYNETSTEELEQDEPLFKSIKQLNALMVLPIKKEGKTIGTFNLYSSEVGFFDKEEINLLTETVADISYGLDLFEKEKRLKITEDLILKNEMRFRSLVENGTDGVAILALNSKFMYVSSSVQMILGYEEGEVENLDILSLTHSDDLQNIESLWSQVLQTPNVSLSVPQVRMLHKSGAWIWVEGLIRNRHHDATINGIVFNFRNVSELVRAAENRTFDKNNLNALINTTNDLMWSVDKNLNLITCNQPYSDAVKIHWGCEVAEGAGILEQNVTTKDKNKAKLLYKRAFAGEEFMEIEHTMFPSESWTQVSYFPIRIKNDVIGCACYCRDITNLKKTEQLLAKSELFSRGILNALNSHIAVVDKSGQIIAVNEAWNRFAINNGGIVTRTSVGSNYFQECERAAKEGIESAALVLTAMKNILNKNDKDFYIEYPCHSPTEQNWFSTTITRFETNEEQIVVAHSNISEQKLAQEHLLNSQKVLKEAQELAMMGSWQLDFNENLLQFSDEGCRIFDIFDEGNKITFRKWIRLIHPEDQIYVLEIVRNSRKEFTDNNYNYRIVNGDGSIIHIYAESKYVFDYNGNAVGLYGIIQDITAQKMAEQDREKITADVVRRNQDLEQFSFMVSHNLRAPVANILGLTQIINDETLQADMKGIVIAGISESVTKLDNVISDLNYILQNKQHANEKKEIVDFAMLTNDIIKSIDSLMQHANVAISCDFEEAPNMLSVKSYLHSIFYNLIHNSIKYRCETGIPRIEITSRLVQNNIVFVFKDNGIGMNTALIGKKIFGLYNRFHTKIADGKGIGLYMVKNQVETLGGTIKVQSELNFGSTFTIQFPV